MRDYGAAILICGSVMLSAAVPALAQADFSGAGATLELDCDGKRATVEGASNTVVITGACASLQVVGAGNRITVDLAAGATIRIEGADNEIRWRAPGDAKPRVTIAGAGNRLSRLR